MCLVPRLWSSGNSHGAHGSPSLRILLPPLHPPEEAAYLQDQEVKLTSSLTSGSSKAVFLHSVQTPALCSLIPASNLPTTNSFSLIICQRLQCQMNNYLHQPKSLDDLSIQTQHPALTSLTFQSTVTFISTPPSPSLLSLPTRPCLHPLKLESSHPGFQL